jgi:hypothetical protein
MSKINTIKLEKRGRPKGVKNGIEHLTVQEIIDKLGADCKLKIPIRTTRLPRSNDARFS